MIQREEMPDQTNELAESISDTLKNLKEVLSKKEMNHCLVNGFADLIDTTSSDFIYYMNEAMIEVAMEDPSIRLIIKSLIQDMIRDILDGLTDEERNTIVANLNGECRAVYQSLPV
jgi:hypothetical protein